MDRNLMERAKTFDFIGGWFQWCELYLSELSARDRLGYGYRGGFFYPNGAHKGQHHDDWPPFFDSMAVHGLPYTSIHALFCYQKFRSCQLFLDGQGFIFP
ncbi:MAG: hypothetical protein F9K32_18400 [Desulfobulbaceae bacterium]|nr:MAG: hypothetical protein F9K32_18400 [Desulfobulbaceae bacterium]